MNGTKFLKEMTKLRNHVKDYGYYENLGQVQLRKHKDFLFSEMTAEKLTYEEYANACTRAEKMVDDL